MSIKHNKEFRAVILAAGEGTRMKSSIPKVLHKVCGKEMIVYVLDVLKEVSVKKIYTVVNKKHVQLLDYLKKNTEVELVFQNKPLGTADALKSAKSALKQFKGNVLVLCADTPLIRQETLRALMDRHIQTAASCTILTAFVENPYGYGRIVRDEYGKVRSIIEENNADYSQKAIKEINSAIYCFKTEDLLRALNQVKVNPVKKEF